MNDDAVRLFLGLWPAAHVVQELAAHAARWQWPETARRTAADRLHVTLHFLGEVTLDRIAPLQHALAPIHWQGCLLHFERPQVWRGGIAVLEAADVPAPLAQLHLALGEALAGMGMEVEQRPYRPHVTLARKAQGAQPPARAAPVAWQATPGFVLVRSLPGGRGYQPLQAFG